MNRSANLLRISALRQCIMVALLLATSFLTEQRVLAQGHGISSDARDFYVGYMPGIRHPGGWTGYTENYYVLVCSYQDNNPVTLYYFGADGSEIQGPTKILTKGRCQQILLDRNQMQPARPGEVLEFKAAHIKSRYPISVQLYDEGSSTGGMYQAIPTSALGKSYVIASWFDNPIQNNPGFLNRDSSSSEFMIIAPYDNTNVTFIPNSTTYAGVLGYKSGAGSDGLPHPKTIQMRKGQVYWVRSFSVDASNDLSGSTVVSDKPVAVLGGQERGLLGDPSGWWLSLDNDIRDVMIEQMTPVEDWGSEYPSIPFMPAQNSDPRFSRRLKNGEGNMYRIYTNDPNGGFMNMWKNFPASAYPTGVSLYQSPAATYDNIEDPVDLMVDSKSVDANGNVKKMYAVMYDYFQGGHDSSPGGLADGDNGKGSQAQSGGGDNPQDEDTYKCPNEMDLVPIDRYRTSTVFKIPFNSTYFGYQFINIITNKDSLSKILVTHNGLSPTPLKAITPMKVYQIPLRPELTGLTLKLAAGDYVITGNTPFACYSYGRTETQYKDGWGYAAPTGEAYGSHSEPNAPQADIVPACDHWDIRLHDTGPGKQEGIADLMLLEDPDGFYTKPGRVSFNTTLVPVDPQFTPGDTSVSFSIAINDPTKDAYAALYVVDRAGNDTVIELHYKAPTITITPANVNFKHVLVGTSVCQDITIKVVATGASSVDTVGVPAWLLNDMSNYGPDGTRKSPTFSWSSTTKLPAALKAGDSVVITVCFAPTDTNNVLDINHRILDGHLDYLTTQVGCGYDTIPIAGKGITPIIDATDLDFGNVSIGDVPCKMVSVKNIGNAPLILDKTWVMKNNPDYTFGDQTQLPDTILPGQTSKLQFCFAPKVTGESDSRMDWGTNIPPQYAHLKKDTSQLLGRAIEPGLTWDRPKQGYTVDCADSETIRVNLLNPPSSTDNISVKKVAIEGPDAAEFTIVNNEPGYLPLQDHLPWQLVKGDTEWLDVQFKPDLSKGFGQRNAYIVAVGTGSSGNLKEYTDTLRLFGIVRHAAVAIVPPSFDFGANRPGVVLTTTFTLTNNGDTTFTVKDLNLVGSDYQILSGLKVGDQIAPGGSVSFIVQYTSPAKGRSSANFHVGGATICSSIDGSATGVATSFGVDGTGQKYNLIYVCPSAGNNTILPVTTQNVGTMGGILHSVQILDLPGRGDAVQFYFDDASRQKILDQGVDGGGIVTLPIRFQPTHRGMDTVMVQYTWRDTSRTDGVNPWVDTVINQLITGIGYNSANVISVANSGPTATAGNGYTAVTKSSVTIPVHLEQAFVDLDSVFGAHFTLRYLRDQFIFDPAATTLGPGLSWQGGVAPTPVADPADNNYELLSVRLTSATPITSTALMNGTWKYVVAKDSITSFQIVDRVFLGRSGDTACWVKDSVVPAPFFGTNVCGDFTLRTYLKTGGVAVSVRQVVPNPINSSARVEFVINQMAVPVTIEVFNALGQNVQTIMKNEILDKGAFERDFDASELSSGLYTIRFSTPGSEVSKSILVNK